MKKLKNIIKSISFLRMMASCFQNTLKRGYIRQSIHFIINGHIIKAFRVVSFLQKNSPKFLQIGGGKHLKLGPKWLNGDIIAGEIYLNATKKLSFPDNSIDVIFTEHFIEHLSQKQAYYFLTEAYRILKPGGIIRQSTPDLEKLINIYLDRNDFVEQQTAVCRHFKNHRKNALFVFRNSCQFINDVFRLWGHKFIYDDSTLEKISLNTGFKELKWVSFGESEHEDLKNLERHASEEWMKKAFVMVYEAKKPTDKQ